MAQYSINALMTQLVLFMRSPSILCTGCLKHRTMISSLNCWGHLTFSFADNLVELLFLKVLCWAIVFLIVTDITWKIDLRHHHIEAERMELLLRGALEEETHCMGSIFQLNLSKNALTSEGVKHLLKFPKQLIRKMETLNLENNKLDSESTHASPEESQTVPQSHR